MNSIQLLKPLTKEDFKKAANSAIGRQLTKTVVDKVDDVFTLIQTTREKAPEKTVPPGTKRPYTEDLPTRKKGKRKKNGNGIIYQYGNNRSYASY